MTPSDSIHRSRSRLLKACLFATGCAGIVAEFVLSTLASYLLGNPTLQWTLVMSMMLFAMGVGSRLSRHIEARLLDRFIAIEFVLSVLCATSGAAAYFGTAVMGQSAAVIYGYAIAIGVLIGMEIPLVARLNEAYEALRLNLSGVMEKGTEGQLPLVLVLPGSTGWSDYTEDRYAHEIPSLGYMVAIIDAKESRHGVASNIPEGHAIVGRSVIDQQGVLDYLCTRPDVDTSRIACMGLSQGGTHTWMLAAMDDRIKVAIPICGVCTYRSLIDGVRDENVDGSFMSFLDSHGIYYYIPGILQVGEQQDLVSLIAPRPLLILGGTTDNCFPEQGVRDVYRDVRRIYRLLNAEKNIDCYLYEGPHGNPPELRERAYAFLEKHL